MGSGCYDASKMTAPSALRRLRLLGLALLPALFLDGCQRETPRPTNVLLLVVDTLRADRLGCYGYPRPTSPNIDRLAARGTLYEHNYSQASWTVPSMISMLTGVSVTTEEQSIPASIKVLAEALHDRGMETAAFPANDVLGHERGFERGFDTWDFTAETVNADAQTLAQRFAGWHGARQKVDGKRRPWFVWMQFLDPHMPYQPKPAFDVFNGPRPDQKRMEARWRAALADAEQRSPNLAGKNLRESMDMMTHYSNLYDGEVRQADDAIGKIMETLEASGELETTLVIVVSDHGEMLFEHRLEPYFVKSRIDKMGGLPEGVADLFGNGHRSWFYEHLWNTPMIMAGPGMPIGKRVSSLSANLDIYPTVLEALDMKRAGWLEGESLFGGAQTRRERVLAHAYFTSAVREQAGLKLIQHPRNMFLLEGPGEEPVDFFDLAQDPYEEKNSANARPEDVERLRKQIADWIARAKREAMQDMTPAQRESLRQNGYIDAK